LFHCLMATLIRVMR